jgi:hypothetical protein
MALSVNGLYHVELQVRWGLSFDIRVDGTVSPSSLKDIDPSADLKKTYFDDYGIGISSYLLLMPGNTTIYIGRPILSYDPFEVSTNDGERIFIPESLINYVNTYSYILAKKYIFEITSGVKRYKNVLEEDRFFKDIKPKIANNLKTLEEFVADNISTEINDVDVLVTNGYLDNLDKERIKLVNKYKAFTIQKQNNYDDEHRSLYEQIIKTQRAEKLYEEQRTALISQLTSISNLEAQNTHVNSILIRVKDVMREMIGKLKSGEMNPDDIPSFDDLYDQVEGEMYG